jgi:hypothetical protein
MVNIIREMLLFFLKRKKKRETNTQQSILQIYQFEKKINKKMRGVKGQRSDRRAPGGTESAGCVRNLDDSPIVAIRITYRISLRSSSAQEPRHPSLKVVSGLYTV